MKKEAIVNVFDVVLLFWALIFMMSPFLSDVDNTAMTIIFEISSLTLIFYVVYVIRLRWRWNRLIKRENDAALEVAAEVSENIPNMFYEVKQRILENQIEATLQSLYPSAKIVKNVYCPKIDGTTSEIDLLMISVDGIFLFEAKNISASVNGDWSSDKLVATYENGKQIEILNPVIQNSYHYQHLKRLLGCDSSVFKNIVVLGDAVIYNYEEIKKAPKFASVCKLKNIAKETYYRGRHTKNIFTPVQVESIYLTIKDSLGYSEEKKEKHIGELQKNETRKTK